MQVTRVRPSDLSPSETARWRALHGEDGDAFTSPDFALVVDRVRSDVWVVVVEDGNEICGFWPFSCRRRVAAPILPGYTNSEGMVHAVGFEWSWHDLLRKSQLVGWRFASLAGEQAWRARGHLVHQSSPVVDLGEGWAAYDARLRRLHGRTAKALDARRRRLHRDHHVQFETGGPPDALDGLIALKRAQCRARGWKDTFGPSWTRQLLHELVEDSHEGLTCVLHSLVVDDDQLAATTLRLRSGRREFVWFTAYDRRFGAYSPGMLSELQALEVAAGDGVRSVDMGKGSEAHKWFLSNAERPVVSGMIGAQGWGGARFLSSRAGAFWARQWLERHPDHFGRMQSAVHRARRIRGLVLGPQADQAA